jgi:cysteine desulfurase
LDRSENKGAIEIVTTTIEHPCVSEVFAHAQRQGVKASFVPVDRHGRVDGGQLHDAVSRNTRLVSLIWVNNEVGCLQDITKLIHAVKAANPDTLVHLDAVQAFGKVEADISAADMVSLSAHKFHGPKGVGALLVKGNIPLAPQILGGGQQENTRSGTINAPAIFAMGKAAEITRLTNPAAGIRAIQTCLYNALREAFGDGVFNTRLMEAEYAPHIVNFSLEGLKGEVLLHMLEEDGIYVSTSSACSSRRDHKDSPLYALGYGRERVDSALRVSASEMNTTDEVDFLMDRLKAAAGRLGGRKAGKQWTS